MASGFGSVASVLTERPPGTGAGNATKSSVAYDNAALLVDPSTRAREPMGSPDQADHPLDIRAEDGRNQGNRAWYDSLLSGREYEVVYDDADGYPLLAFSDGQWYDVTSPTARPVTVRYALRLDPAWAGAVVQTVCLWMRSNPHHTRSFELATELALAVGELARV